MGGKPFTERDRLAVLQFVDVHKHKDGTPNHIRIAKETGLHRQTVKRILDMEQIREPETPVIEMPAFADPDEPIEDIIAKLERNFHRAKAAQESRTWFEIKVKEDLPIGLAFVGDPHVDDNGCNWPALRKHGEICRKTPGLFALNSGDSANYWGGRLIRKYADQDTSAQTARRLVEWLFLDSGFRWLVWLMGNHEFMSDAGPLIREMAKRFGTQNVPMLDWEARFILKFSNGEQFRINAAHNFQGHSMWNPVHGAVKTAMFGDRLDVIACADKHNWAISQWELAEQGTAPLMIRSRGYKHLDDYAKKLGKHEQEDGQSVVVIFDPNAKTRAGRTLAFADLEAGADYLGWLRGR